MLCGGDKDKWDEVLIPKSNNGKKNLKIQKMR